MGESNPSGLSVLVGVRVHEMNPQPAHASPSVPWPTPDESVRMVEMLRTVGRNLDHAADDARVDPEMKKNVWECKGFNKRVSRYTNEKGAQEFKAWSYELQRVTSADPNFHEFVRWLEEAKLEKYKGQITKESLERISTEKKVECEVAQRTVVRDSSRVHPSRIESSRHSHGA